MSLYWQLNIGFMVVLIFYSVLYVLLSSVVLDGRGDSIFFVKLNRFAVPIVLLMCYLVIVSNLVYGEGEQKYFTYESPYIVESSIVELSDFEEQVFENSEFKVTYSGCKYGVEGTDLVIDLIVENKTDDLVYLKLPKYQVNINGLSIDANVLSNKIEAHSVSNEYIVVSLRDLDLNQIDKVEYVNFDLCLIKGYLDNAPLMSEDNVVSIIKDISLGVPTKQDLVLKCPIEQYLMGDIEINRLGQYQVEDNLLLVLSYKNNQDYGVHCSFNNEYGDFNTFGKLLYSKYLEGNSEGVFVLEVYDNDGLNNGGRLVLSLFEADELYADKPLPNDSSLIIKKDVIVNIFNK